MLGWMDGEWGKASPLNSVTKLSAIMNKSKGRIHYAKWVILTVKDRILCGQSSLQDGWSESLLTGASDKSGKGIIDFYMYKYDLKTYLLGPLMEMHPFQSEAKEVLRTIFADHHAYRAKVRPVVETPPGGAEPDLSFMANWRKSTELLAALVESFVFESRDDGLLKVSMKARKTPSEFFTGAYDSAKEKLDAVLAAICTETTEQSKQADSEVQAASARALSCDADEKVDLVTAELQAKGLGEEDIKAYRLKAERAVKAYTKLVSIKGLSETQVKDLISDSVPGKASAAALLYDSKLVGETRTAPHIRVPPFSEAHALLCIGGSHRAAPRLAMWVLGTWCCS